MIQKIRSYLLDDKENKEFIGWFVVILMLVPLLSYYFIKKNEKTNFLGSVNGEKISKGVFRIKLYQQALLLETINKALGEKEANYLISLFFQGRSPEEYLFSEAIQHAFLSYLFKKNISLQDISKKKIISDSLNNENFFKQTIGEVFYNLISKEVKDDYLKGLLSYTSMEDIDSFICHIYQNNFLKLLLQVYFGAIEKVLFRNYKMPSKIFYNLYIFDKKKNQFFYKDSLLSNEIEENELQNFYAKGIKKGLYKKKEICTFSCVKYAINEKMKKEFSKKSNEKERKKILEEKLKDLIKGIEKEEEIKKILEKNFSRVKCEEKIEVMKEKGVFISKKIYPQEVLEKAFESFKDSFSIVVTEDSIYFLNQMMKSKDEFLSFEDARQLVLDTILEERFKDVLNEEITKIRYELEEKELFSLKNDVWQEQKKIFELKKYVENKEEFLDNTLMSKLKSGGIKEKATFWEEKDDKVFVFFITNIEKEQEEVEIYSKRMNMLPSGIFIENLMQYAKIDIEEKDNVSAL